MGEVILNVDVHESSNVIGFGGRVSRSIDGQLLVVGSDSMELSIIVPMESSLEELIGRVSDSGNNSSGREGNLFDFGEVIDGISIQFDGSDLDDGELIVFPELGAIKGKWVLVSLFLLHDLDGEFVSGEISSIDGLSKILSEEVVFLARDEFGFLIRHSLLSEFGDDVESDPDSLILFIDEAEGIGSPCIHGSETQWSSDGIGEDHQGSMESFGVLAGVIPQHVGVVESSSRISLPCMDRIGSSFGISSNEDGEIDAEKIPVALFGVEFDGKSSDISLNIWISLLDECARQSDRDFGFLANLGEEFGFADVADVIGDSELSMSSISQRMNVSGGNLLSNELSGLLHEGVIILE